MHTLVINLSDATERMAFQRAQLDRLGLSWERVDAVTPATLQPAENDPVWHRWQRPLRVTEMALLASHRVAWRRVAALNEPCLVLEDDAYLTLDAPEALRAIAPLTGVDHVSLETRSRKKLLGRRRHPAAPIRRMYQDRTGSAAYILFPRGARLLLAATEQSAAPSDAAISSCYALKSFQADPALCIQLDQCDAYGVTPPVQTRSSIDAVRKPPAEAFYTRADAKAFRRRRILAQLRMGWRQLVHLPVAHRVHVMPGGDWPRPGAGDR